MKSIKRFLTALMMVLALPLPSIAQVAAPTAETYIFNFYHSRESSLKVTKIADQYFFTSCTQDLRGNKNCRPVGRESGYTDAELTQAQIKSRWSRYGYNAVATAGILCSTALGVGVSLAGTGAVLAITDSGFLAFLALMGLPFIGMGGGAGGMIVGGLTADAVRPEATNTRAGEEAIGSLRGKEVWHTHTSVQPDGSYLIKANYLDHQQTVSQIESILKRVK